MHANKDFIPTLTIFQHFHARNARHYFVLIVTIIFTIPCTIVQVVKWFHEFQKHNETRSLCQNPKGWHRNEVLSPNWRTASQFGGKDTFYWQIKLCVIEGAPKLWLPQWSGCKHTTQSHLKPFLQRIWSRITNTINNTVTCWAVKEKEAK